MVSIKDFKIRTEDRNKVSAGPRVEFTNRMSGQKRNIRPDHVKMKELK